MNMFLFIKALVSLTILFSPCLTIAWLVTKSKSETIILTLGLMPVFIFFIGWPLTLLGLFNIQTVYSVYLFISMITLIPVLKRKPFVLYDNPITYINRYIKTHMSFTIQYVFIGMLLVWVIIAQPFQEDWRMGSYLIGEKGNWIANSGSLPMQTKENGIATAVATSLYPSILILSLIFAFFQTFIHDSIFTEYVMNFLPIVYFGGSVVVVYKFIDHFINRKTLINIFILLNLISLRLSSEQILILDTDALTIFFSILTLYLFSRFFREKTVPNFLFFIFFLSFTSLIRQYCFVWLVMFSSFYTIIYYRNNLKLIYEAIRSHTRTIGVGLLFFCLIMSYPIYLYYNYGSPLFPNTIFIMGEDVFYEDDSDVTRHIKGISTPNFHFSPLMRVYESFVGVDIPFISQKYISSIESGYIPVTSHLTNFIRDHLNSCGDVIAFFFHILSQAFKAIFEASLFSWLIIILYFLGLYGLIRYHPDELSHDSIRILLFFPFFIIPLWFLVGSWLMNDKQLFAIVPGVFMIAGIGLNHIVRRLFLISKKMLSNYSLLISGGILTLLLICIHWIVTRNQSSPFLSDLDLPIAFLGIGIGFSVVVASYMLSLKHFNSYMIVVLCLLFFVNIFYYGGGNFNQSWFLLKTAFPTRDEAFIQAYGQRKELIKYIAELNASGKILYMMRGERGGFISKYIDPTPIWQRKWYENIMFKGLHRAQSNQEVLALLSLQNIEYIVAMNDENLQRFYIDGFGAQKGVFNNKNSVDDTERVYSEILPKMIINNDPAVQLVFTEKESDFLNRKELYKKRNLSVYKVEYQKPLTK